MRVYTVKGKDHYVYDLESELPKDVIPKKIGATGFLVIGFLQKIMPIFRS